MSIMSNVARNLGMTAVEGLAHLGLDRLATRMEATTDMAAAAALSAVVALEREVHAAAQALGRAPRWCGVCSAVAVYRTQVSNLVAAEPDDEDDGYLSPSDHARGESGDLGSEWDR